MEMVTAIKKLSEHYGVSEENVSVEFDYGCIEVYLLDPWMKLWYRVYRAKHSRGDLEKSIMRITR